MKSSLVLGITVLVVAGFLAGVLLQPMIMISQPIQDEDNVIKIIPIVRVYKDGELVYEKIGDPPTNNLAHLFFAVIAPRKDTTGANFKLSITTFDGVAWNPIISDGDTANELLFEHTLWVVAGTGTSPPSYNDYTVTLAGYGEATVVNYFFDSATNEWVLKIAGSITFGASYNITEIGLTIDVASSPLANNPSTTPDDNVLIFRDVLSQSIQVVNGDVLEVQYEIRFKLP